jgi:hypothetical protein
MEKNIDYVVIPELPQEHQQPFIEWLTGQTIPLIEGEGENSMKCAYKWDYDKWLSYWSNGRIAPVTD